jgi:D-sedoheptulose 7-phosphate isomerase
LADSGHITCVGNDFGFEEIFARPILALADQRDAVLLLSTSGQSQNLIRAAEAAKEKGATVVAFTGRGGGPLAELADFNIDFPGQGSDRIQELQMLALHALVEHIEAALGLE